MDEPELPSEPETVAGPPPRASSPPAALARTERPKPAQPDEPEPPPPPSDVPARRSIIPSKPLPPTPPDRVGQIDDLEKLFESEPRASEAGVVESRVNAALFLPGMPPNLLKGITCKTTVCRLDLTWSEATDNDFLDLQSRLMGTGYRNGEKTGLSGSGPPGPNGERAVSMYWTHEEWVGLFP